MCRPGLDICLNIIFSGRCNTAVKTEPDMNPEEFIEGALHATSEVTRALANGDLVDKIQHSFFVLVCRRMEGKWKLEILPLQYLKAPE